MDSHVLIDSQFDRAVEIVQSLPKNGPVQTDYEEKLTMYSLYKQATVGNVTTPRPGIWDMLGRAKWDAWAKHKDLDSYQAKWLYVDALMKVLKKYPEKTYAKELVQELESYAGDPSNILMSRTLSRGSNSSGSSGSDIDSAPYSTPYSAHLQATISPRYYQNQMGPLPERGESTSEDGAVNDDDRGLPAAASYQELIERQRPISSMSGQRYRTPMTGSMISPPPMSSSVPAQQPLPRYETQSAFDDDRNAPNSLPAATTTYPSHLAPSSRSDAGGITVPMHPQAFRGAHQAPTSNRRLPMQMPPRPTSRPSIERAVENVQAHLAALTERLEALELSTQAYRSSASVSPRGSHSPPHGSNSNDGRAGRPYVWDLDDMGLWSIILQPISRVVKGMRHVIAFLAVNESRTPTFVVVRRLLLDLSFILCVLAVFKVGWRRSGIRRGEILTALGVLGRAVVGERRSRHMIDQGV